MGGKLKSVLGAIGEGNCPAAFDVLETFEIDYWKETILNDVVLAFVVPAKSAAAQKRLADSMRGLAAKHSHPAGRALAKCILGTAYRVRGEYYRAAETFEDVLNDTQNGEDPLIRGAFEGYLVSQLGTVLAKYSPARAIPYLERFRAGHGLNAGAEFYAITLGRAYLATGQAEKALEVFSWLENLRSSGQTIAAEELKGAIHSGLVASLDRLGRHAEAQALADPLLAKHGYGEPISSLSSAKRRNLVVLLNMMGRDEEAKEYAAGR